MRHLAGKGMPMFQRFGGAGSVLLRRSRPAFLLIWRAWRPPAHEVDARERRRVEHHRLLRIQMRAAAELNWRDAVQRAPAPDHPRSVQNGSSPET
jgi:hypothetical protein